MTNEQSPQSPHEAQRGLHLIHLVAIADFLHQRGELDRAQQVEAAKNYIASTLPAAASVEAGERARILSEVRAALRKFEGACVHTEIMSQDYRTGFEAGFNGADLAILDMINALTAKGKDQADG